MIAVAGRDIDKSDENCRKSRPQILAPTPQQIEAFRTIHNDVEGHFGRDKTYRKLCAAFASGTVDVQLSKELVAACIQRCTLCQKMEYAKRRGGEESLARNFISRQEPFEEISIDAFGPMVPDRANTCTHALAQQKRKIKTGAIVSNQANL